MDEDELIEQILEVVARMVETGRTIPPELIREISGILQERIQGLTAPISVAPAIPSGAELVWILSGENPQVFTQYLKTIPDPALNALVRNPSALQHTIQDLSRRITPPAGEVQDGIPKADLQSSNVYGFAYNPRDQSLFVRFNNGGVYEYGDVPPRIFKIFAQGAVPAKTSGQNRWGKWWRGKIPSLGAAFYQMIREGGFPYQKVA